MAATLAAVALGLALKMPAPTPVTTLAVLGGIAAIGWLLINERYELSLALLMLYVGLLDGFLKLKTGNSQVTLGRDLLLYGIAAGALVRMAVRREQIRWPPLSGWILAWIVVIAVQLLNPHDGTLLHSLAAVRPHAEWVPLFFLGYLVMRSKKRLRNFMLLLLVIAAANGVVGLIQLNMTPEQLSGWGPGYAQAIQGDSSVSARVFVDEEDEVKNRPFALGGDIGFGGAVGFLAVPAALALLALPGPALRWRLFAALLSIGVVMAVLTSEGRVHVLASVVAILAFAGLTLISRGGMRTLVGVVVGVVIAYVAIGTIFSHTSEGSFDRYNTITSPGEAVSTAYNYRKATLEAVPKYIAEIPLGAGIGSKGPAEGFGGGDIGGKSLNGESEPTFLLIEAGVPGLVVMVGFNLVLLCLSITRIRTIPDRETRILLTGIAAPLFALVASWFAGVSTATTPGAPYMWFAAGTLSYWLLGEGRRRSAAGPKGAAAPAPALIPAAGR
jgi:hypothetical protein